MKAKLHSIYNLAQGFSDYQEFESKIKSLISNRPTTEEVKGEVSVILKLKNGK